jgi:hypothetical protein
MTHHLLATVLTASEEAAHSEGGIPPEAWMIGAGALLVFLVLLFVVTRLNLDR